MNTEALLGRIRDVHARIRDSVLAAFDGEGGSDALAAPVAHEGGDTIFAVDRLPERVLLDGFGDIAREWPCVLIAEGLGASGVVDLSHGRAPLLRIIVDPIDGTRGLMYQKRPAWVLTGVAADRGDATSLADIELAVMTEIPLVKQHLCDTLWAVRGEGVGGERFDRIAGTAVPLAPRPSRADSIEQGFGGVSRFFPGARDVLAAIEEEVVEEVLGKQPPAAATAFEDQYLSTGGQLYELMMGHDRWIADLRPLVEPVLRERGMAPGLYCHPYDLCVELIAREAGVLVTAPDGAPLDAPLDVTTGLAWTGYANAAIASKVAPALRRALARRQLA